MKWKFMAKTVAHLKAFFGVEELPISAEGTVAFTDDQIARLEKELGPGYAQKITKGLNKELKDMSQADQSLKAIKDEIDAMLLETNLSEEEKKNLTNGNADDGDDTVAKMKALSEKLKEQNLMINKLIAEPEGDSPAAIIKNFGKGNMQHSATHLFASGKDYDAFDKRPWNARLRDGSIKATDFNNDSVVPTLQGDLEHFVRQNPDAIESLFVDTEDLPADWNRTSNVQDQISSAFVIAAEIVQGRKKGWAPKNNVKFDTETRKVYRKKIDITFDGYELQQVENTWISSIKNMDGSHPWKMSFVAFLLSEILKQQRVDDRVAQINGIVSVGGDGDTPGAAVNSQNGLRYLWYYYRDVAKKYRPFSVGVPTESNIVDYVENMIMMIPEDYRKMQGLEIQISDRWKRAYNKKAGEIYNLQYSTDLGKKDYSLDQPIDRPNFKFQVLKDQTLTDFIGFTFSKNVDVIEYKPEEKNRFTFTYEKRNMNIFADYRLGIGFIFVGTKTVAGDPKQFQKQVLWSNDVPVFGTETNVPIFDDRSGILKINYPTMVVDEKWVTDVTEAEGEFVPGQVIRITGNTALAGTKSLKDGAMFDLVGNVDYPLNTAGTITLFVKDDKTFKELSRTITAPAVASNDVTFSTATIDANLGKVFRWSSSASTTAVTGIINGVEGQSIKIYGKTGVALTLSDTGNIDVLSNATLDADTDMLQLTLVNGKWMETNRVTT